VLDAQLGQRVADGVDHGSEGGRRSPSPPPRKPKGWDVEGTSLISVVNEGSMSARGRAYSISVEARSWPLSSS